MSIGLSHPLRIGCTSTFQGRAIPRTRKHFVGFLAVLRYYHFNLGFTLTIKLESCMTTNSRTWFYNEPEHRPYYIEERVNQNLWASRFGSIYMDCVRAEPPFRMEGVWNNINVAIEWVSPDTIQ